MLRKHMVELLPGRAHVRSSATGRSGRPEIIGE
jgi:hypothetical protein